MSQASLIPTASPSPIFAFKDHEIRTIMQDGQPWFVARDVCAALALTWTGKTLSQIPDDWQRMCNLHIRRGNYEIRVISEPAVYKLAFRSNKAEADEFTNWVASEVLPTIRKTGKYDAVPTPEPKRRRKALGTGIPALPCVEPVLDPATYAKGKRIFDMMSKLMTDFDLVKTHVQLWAHPGGRLARLSPEKETIYQNAADASKMALCSLNQAQYALRIAMGIKATHSFDGR